MLACLQKRGKQAWKHHDNYQIQGYPKCVFSPEPAEGEGSPDFSKLRGILKDKDASSAIKTSQNFGEFSPSDPDYEAFTSLVQLIEKNLKNGDS